MADFSKLSAQMRADWDRRVKHDYRFWMSDGHSSDEVMWASGERDLRIMTADIANPQDKTILEVGCGVGRILKSALSNFGKVVGLDVSEEAIKKAGGLLNHDPRLTLHIGNGFDLKPVADGSVDVVLSFAALCSIPVDVVAHYLIEMHRVLKPSGVARLQIYLGTPQEVSTEDTLHLRCYDRRNFDLAVEAAGFSVEKISELILPFQVSFKESGIEAVTVALKRQNREPQPYVNVRQLLSPEGQATEVIEAAQGDLEYWMSINYAKELAESGDFEKAKATIEYATSFAKNAAIDIGDLLNQIALKAGDTAVNSKVSTSTIAEPLLIQNLEVLRQRFPEVASQLESEKLLSGPLGSDTEIRQSQEGPVVYYNTQCLDHPDKPRAAGERWSSREIQEAKQKEIKKLFVFGFGSGWHLDSLVEFANFTTSVIEPIPSVFAAALRARDLRNVLQKIESLSIGTKTIPTFPKSESELCLRPQSQASASKFCGEVKAKFYGSRGLTLLKPMIGVLGPLQGGTLPMTGYTIRALQSLKQRSRTYDVSGFAPGYHLVSNFLADKLRQATTHGAYLEMVSHVVLESINEKPIDILICMAQAPISGKVLNDLRKRGVITVLWFVEDYLRFTYWREMAQYYDFVFTIQKGQCLDLIKKAGAGEVHYLPSACDPVIHTPMTLTPEEKARWGSPISFVGAGYHNRQQMFSALADMPFKIWGTEWPECRPFDRLVQEKGRRLAPEEYTKIFNATEINLNLHSSTERDGVEPNGDFVNPRTVELAVAGAFQLVDERTHLPEMFEPGKELVTFTDVYDLKQKIAYYLDRPEERRKIAEAGRARALRNHTYGHRIMDMLSTIYSSRFETVKRRLDASPWHKMLARAEGDEELKRRCNVSFERGEEPTLDGLIADVVSGKGKLSETEQKLLFLYHVRKQIINMRTEGND